MINVQTVVLVVMLLIFGLNAITGYSRGFWRTLLRLATLVVAFFVAIVLSKALAAPLSEYVITYIEAFMANGESAGELMELWNKNPSFAAAAETLIALITPSLFFIFVYWVLKLVTLILYWIFAGCCSVPKAKGKPLMRLAGLGVGLVAGLIGAIVFVTPILGYSNLMGTVIDNMTEGQEPDPTFVEVKSYLASVTTAPVASQVYHLLGAPTFSGLTSTDWEGEKVMLEHEIDAVIVVFGGLSTISDASTDIADFGAKEATALDQVAGGVGDSRLLSVIVADVFKNASSAWLSGESFLGMASPATGDNNAIVIINGFLKVLSTSTPQTVGEDLGFVADMVALLAKHEIFALLGEDSEQGVFVRKLAESDFLEEALSLLNSNERMKPMTKALTDIGAHMLIEELGVPDDYFEEHPELMNTMGEIVKTAADENGNLNKEVLESELNGALEEYDIVIEPAAVELIAIGFAEEFTAEELITLTPTQIAERIVAHLGSVDGLDDLLEQLPQE